VAAEAPRSRIPDWISASDLAEYAYCPRALHYRRHPPAAGEPEASVRRRSAGDDFHREYGRSLIRRSRSAGVWTILFLAAVVGLGILLTGAVLGWF
jgi:hypothetical protein